MRRMLTMGVVLVLLLMILAVAPANAAAANVGKITPSKGKAGRSVVIHGSGLKGQTVEVKFGDVPGSDVRARNGKTIKVTVPEKDATDPDPIVLVTVIVDGITAEGDLIFEYRLPK